MVDFNTLCKDITQDVYIGFIVTDYGCVSRRIAIQRSTFCSLGDKGRKDTNESSVEQDEP